MPIYLEGRNVANLGGASGGHMYLVYVPIGEEDNYSAWKTIGAFPSEIAGIPGPWGTLTVPFKGTEFEVNEGDDYTENFLWAVAGPGVQSQFLADNINSTPEEVEAAYQIIFASYLDAMAAARGRDAENPIFEGLSKPVEDSVWEDLIEAADSFDGNFTYKGVTFDDNGPWPAPVDLIPGATVNSNSIMANVIRVALGIDIGGMLPTPDPGDNDYFPGWRTLLGTDDGETLTMTGEMNAIYGGKGADILNSDSVGGDADTHILVAGDDLEIDTMNAGAGDDILFGYYNQNDLSHSDKFIGGFGDNQFIVVDPTDMLLGGLPDTTDGGIGGNTGFMHIGTVTGSGGEISGGGGYDTLDFRYVNGGVSVLVTSNTITLVEAINGSNFIDTFYFAGDLPEELIVLNEHFANEEFIMSRSFHADVLDMSDTDASDGLTITLETYLTSGSVWDNAGGTQPAVFFLGVADVVGTAFDDTIMGNLTDNALFGNDGDDEIDGGLGHDDLYGGQGNDTILGDEGADFIYDNGAEQPFHVGDDVEEYVESLQAYDGGLDAEENPTGNDVIDGGDGSDKIFYSGGQDIFNGGTGNDTYYVSPDYHENEVVTDHLRIVVSEDPEDEATWFGHDTINGAGQGIEALVFHGLSADDVIINFEFTSELVDTLGDDVPAFALSLIGIPGWDLGTYPIFQLTGSIEIIVKATGSSILIENVSGAQVGGSNNPFGNIYVKPQIFSPFAFVFDEASEFDLEDPTADLPAAADVYSNWGSLIVPQDTILLESGAISAGAGLASLVHDIERASSEPIVPETDGGGTDGVDDLAGGSGKDYLNGGAMADNLNGGGGEDLLIGGLGADTIDGGDGIDTASYADASEGASISLETGASAFPSAALGDVLINIENLQGSAFDDTLSGDGGDNALYGGDGDDYLNGGGGNDLLVGGAGSDELYASDGDDMLLAGDGNDLLSSWHGTDYLDGGAGDDMLYASDGGDTYRGGVGNDTLSFIPTGQPIAFPDAVTADLSTGTASSAFHGDMILIDVENLIGDDANDTFVGNERDNILNGGRGDDTLFGGGGDDHLIGGTGDNVMHGGLGVDTAVFYNETVFDVGIYSANYADMEFRWTDEYLEIIHPSGRSDFVGSDVEFFEFPDGTYSFIDIALTLPPRPNEFLNDTISAIEGEIADVVVLDNDRATLDSSVEITAIAGQAILEGETVTLEGGQSVTLNADGTLSIDQNGTFEYLGDGEAATLEFEYIVADENGLLSIGKVEFVVDGKSTLIEGTDSDDLPLTGTDGADIIVGFAGNDILQGGDGDDRFVSNAGTDSFDGGAGFDTLDFSDVGSSGSINLDTGEAIFGGVTETLTNIEGAIGGSGNDTLTGNDDDNVLDGRGGNDDIYGLGGDDWITGQGGADNFYGGDGVDTIDFTYSTSDITIDLVNELTTFSGGTVEVTQDFENVNGSSGANIIIGNAEDNVLDGREGNDTISGNDGNDTLYGGTGNDVLNGGNDSDTLWAGTGTNTLNGGAGNDALHGGDGDDTYNGGDGDDFLHGSAGIDMYDGGSGIDTIDFSYSRFGATFDMGSDLITFTGGVTVESFVGIENVIGTGGVDTIIADAAANVLEGGEGDDTITGGGGADLYRFSKWDGNDTITDFDTSEDIVEIDGVALDPTNPPAGVAIMQDGSDVLISHGLHDTVVLTGVDLAVWQANAPIVNAPPVATDDTVVVLEDGGMIAIDVLANDSDADGVTLISVSDAENGTVSIVGGQLNYEPNPDFHGEETLTYEVSDGQGGVSTANVTITVTSVNDLPIAAADVNVTATNSGAIMVDVLANDGDADGGIPSLNAIVSVTDGSASVANGKILYTPTPGFNGSVIVTYEISDGQGGITTTDLTIDVADNVATIVAPVGDDASDTYFHTTGNGNYTITDYDPFSNTGTDTLAFADVNSDEVTLQAVGNDLVVTLTNGEVITVTDHFGEHADYALEQISFADGITLDAQGIRDRSVADQVASGIVTGTMLGENYFHASGDGSYAITDEDLHSQSGTDTLTFTDVGFEAVTLHREGDDLFITMTDGGTVDVITIINHFQANGDFALETITFAGGWVTDLTTISDDIPIQIHGTEGDDVINGSDGADTIFGRGGNDTIDGRYGDDIIYGGDGNDWISGYAGADSFYGGEGVDTIDFTYSSSSATIDLENELTTFSSGTVEITDGFENVNGTNGANTIVGDSSDNTLNGMGGNDTIEGRAGNDTLIGGSGNNVFGFSSGDGNDIIVDFAAANDSLDLSGVLFPDFEFSQVGSDVLVTYGNGADSILFQNTTLLDIQGEFPAVNIIHGTDASNETHLGTSMDDVIYGHGGKDWFEAGENLGNDVFIGADDKDTVSYTTATAGVIVNLETGQGTGGVATGDRWTEIEVVQTSDFDDVVYGSQNEDTVWLHGGNNQFYGEGGDDTVRVTTGIDYIDGGAGYDYVSFKASSGHIIDIYAEGDVRKTTDMDTYISVEWITAHNFDDVITIGSGTGVEILEGGNGDDILNIFANSGTFIGGSGNDAFHFNPDNLLTAQTDVIVSDFNIAQDSLTVLGEIINVGTSNLLPAGMVYSEDGAGNVVLTFGDGDMITFIGISLDDWLSGAITGTELDDTIFGTGDADIIVSGAGNDTITAKGGNDTIIYESGDDTIMGDVNTAAHDNTGYDTLDLSKYAADQVSFSISGHNTVITTPDGSITLHYQLRHAVGDSRSNIEQVIFSDGTLDEAWIKARSLSDQTTDGNDVISGSNQSDIISSDAGNDTITAKGGSDTIIYEGGNDTIMGHKSNYGFDTLDLSKYSSDQVTFSIAGNNVVIDTPDGSVTLHYQVRYSIEDSKSNIEQIVFSDGTLDEAGIRNRTILDQITDGDDIVSGTRFGDVINAGVGNDTISGLGGADVFEFDAGDGQDIITDFADGAEFISLLEAGLTFADLTIVDDVNGDASINYGGIDTVTLEGVTAAQLTADDFVFV